ncbi:MAG TPA: acyl-CoA dehydrogenase family protein [Ktedonobacterales bacterium]
MTQIVPPPIDTDSTTTAVPDTAVPDTAAPARVGAMPDTRDLNYYDADPYLRFLLARRLPAHEREAGEALLREMGAMLGSYVEDLSAEADRQTPVLRVRDRCGERIDEVVVSPAYRELEKLFYGRFGLAAMSLADGVAGLPGRGSLLLNDALIYLAEQVESGLFCPLSMTRALSRTIIKFAPDEIVAHYLPHLTTTDMERLYTGAMFMTEKQGGSDLGIITTTARPSTEHPSWWELDGEKWFCSNVSADLILALARPEGASQGTRGLGLFLVPRELPDGTRNPYRIERLKDKLGVRDFASGEVTFTRTLAYLIGGPGAGWHQMTEMVNVTRLGCASAAAALARRSFLEALVHARGRIAFGRPLADLPLMREQLLDMLLDVEALTALYFEGSAQMQAADEGDERARLVSRVLTPLAKYHVADESRRVVAEGIEVRGGNAFIEDWPNPRLLRDVHVQAVWEGTGNISALDVGRAISREGAGVALLAALRERLAAPSVQRDLAIRSAATLAGRALDRIERALHAAAQRDPEEREMLTRRVTRDLAHAVTSSLLVEDAAAQAAAGDGYRCLVQAARYLRRYVFPPRGGHASEVDRTPLDHFDAMVDWQPALPASAAEPLLSALANEA